MACVPLGSRGGAICRAAAQQRSSWDCGRGEGRGRMRAEPDGTGHRDGSASQSAMAVSSSKQDASGKGDCGGAEGTRVGSG